ncbi:hypothetical protein [Dactylosporangium sp. NPDC051541]|uniref:hypothetical protein n=1 Tax=Dactylosporangium sp. NPDC051541 TaxID=3363977 RepID=UPI00379C2109
MTSETASPHASGPHGSLFLAAAEAAAPPPALPAPDDSEAALSRLRTPFDVQPGDVSPS